MVREYINPPDIAAPPVNLYNHVVKVGNTVYIAGQVPRGLDGKAAHIGDPDAQIRIAGDGQLIPDRGRAGRVCQGERSDDEDASRPESLLE